MRSDILKFFSFLFTLTLLSCGGGGGDDTGGGGGGGGGGGPTPTPPGEMSAEREIARSSLGWLMTTSAFLHWKRMRQWRLS